MGGVLAVDVPGPLKAPLEKKLTFHKKIRLRGPEATRAYREGRSVYTTREVPCFIYEKRPPHRMVLRIGFLELLVKYLNRQGYRPTLANRLPPLRPDAFETDLKAAASVYKSFRPGQRESLEMLPKFYSGRIDCPTGWGKTAQIVLTCRYLPNAKIDIVTPSVRLLQDTYDALLKYFPNTGIFHASKKFRGPRINCYSMGCLAHSDFDADIALFDECHRCVAEQSAKVVGRYVRTNLWGFSASHVRGDGSDLRLLQMFGPVRSQISYDQAVQDGSVSPIEVIWLNMNLPSNPAEGYSEVPKMRVGIWEHYERNRRLALAVRKFSDAGTTVLVGVRTLQHGVHLRQFLPGFPLVYAKGAMNAKRREEFIFQKLIPPDEPEMNDVRGQWLRDQFRAGKLPGAVANSVWDTGVDFPDLSVAARADGLGSETIDIQFTGRTSRIGSDGKPKQSRLLDCWDGWDEGFERNSRKRWKTYEKMGWSQSVVEWSEEADDWLWPK